MVALATETLVRTTTRSGEKLKAKKINPSSRVEPVVFRSVQHPELMFMTGGEVIVNGYGQQRIARPGEWKRFVNTMFIATTAEELDYCRSQSHIFEEPPIPETAKDEFGNLDRDNDPRQEWVDEETGFRTHNHALWNAYMKKLRS